MRTRQVVGELGGPLSADGLELRNAVNGTIKLRDIDEAKGQVDVEFPHEVVDSYKTKFGKRAFEESFAHRLPVMCWQHHLDDPIGRSLSAIVKPKTNDIVGQLSNFDDVPNARRTWSQIDDGTITDFSFGFKGAHYEPGGQRGVRRITKAHMAEFSPVTIGSIPGAGAVGVREDGTMEEPEYELGQLLHMRDSGLLTPVGFKELVELHFPDLAGKLNIRDITGDDFDVDDPSGSAAMNLVNGPKWDATQAGLHTATGPTGEALIAFPSGDRHAWSVTDANGTSIGTGMADDADSAKRAAVGALPNRSIDPKAFECDLNEVDASTVREALRHYDKRLADHLESVTIALEPLGDGGTRSPEGDVAPVVDEYATTLVQSFRAAVDGANQWFDDSDLAALPDGVQQGIALVRAAGQSVEGMIEALGIVDPEELTDLREDDIDLEERADKAGMSSKPWGDFKDSDYSDEQYKNAALIKGKDKSDSHLPIKEPDGTVNINALSAAAGRLDQTDATPEQKATAAKALMSQYAKLGKKCPPNVLKAASGNRADEGPTEEEQRAAAEELQRTTDAAEAALDRALSRGEKALADADA